MTITVLLPSVLSSASWMSASDSESSEEVASSSNKDRRIFEYGAGDGHTLALAAGKFDAALADKRLVLSSGSSV